MYSSTFSMLYYIENMYFVWNIFSWKAFNIFLKFQSILRITLEKELTLPFECVGSYMLHHYYIYTFMQYVVKLLWLCTNC